VATIHHRCLLGGQETLSAQQLDSGFPAITEPLLDPRLLQNQAAEPAAQIPRGAADMIATSDTKTVTKRAGLAAVLVAAAAMLGGLAMADAAAMPGLTVPLTPSIPIPPPSPGSGTSANSLLRHLSSSQTSAGDLAPVQKRIPLQTP
jgi:hypothetical protein